ncbi:MAG: acetyl-CoA carboxylase carboxyl transferase subunit alpha, partial [Polaribacter sp.]|nr:acetyl-CoA carboxylase carboxyl transferase subunit alpha [Polaribacter sp.]
VISPENCSSILWRSWEHKEKAAEALKLTAEDGIKLKIVDAIIKEPLGGAHSDRVTTFKEVEKTILEVYESLKDLKEKDLVMQRMEKYSTMGVYKE